MGRERTGTGGGGLAWVLLALALASCGSRKAEVCARLHPVLLAQFRMHDELAEHLRDAGTCEAQARRLRAQVAMLRALSVSDAALAGALREYLTQVEALAQVYAESARVHRERPEGSGDVSLPEMRALAVRLTEQATEVDRAGLSLLGTCQGP